VELALAEVPELQPVVAEHLADNDELLLHLLMSDIRRFLVSAFEAGEHEVVARGLAFLGRALTNGDEHVNNAVAASFVEDSWDEPKEFIESWPAELRDEKSRQDAWSARLRPRSADD
jgi:hypothetical protein